MINLLLLLVYLLIWLFFQLEPPGSSWNQLEPPGSSWNLVGLGSSGTNWKFTSNWNPGGKFGGCSLLIWQVPYSENSSQNLPGSDWFQSEPVGHSKDLHALLVPLPLYFI